MITIARNKINLLITFGLVYLPFSFITTNDILPNSVTILLWLAILSALLVLCRGRIDKRIIIVVATLILLMLVTNLIRQENLVVYAKTAFSFFVAAIYVSIFSLIDFVKCYIKIIRFLSIVSLVGYFLHIVAPSLFNVMIVQNTSGNYYSNWILYIQYCGAGGASMRNCGFAWEPGAFATCICLSMFFELFVLKEGVNKKNVFLYILTIVTTFSTTGIIACVVLCIYATMISTELGKKDKRGIAICCVIALILVLPFSDMFFATSNSTFGKLSSYFNSDSSRESSTSVRVNAITKAFTAFLNRPIFGWGYTGLRDVTYEYTLGMNTCTFINWFAVYGLLFGGIMITGITKFSKYLGGGVYLKDIYCFVFLHDLHVRELCA